MSSTLLNDGIPIQKEVLPWLLTCRRKDLGSNWKVEVLFLSLNWWDILCPQVLLTLLPTLANDSSSGWREWKSFPILSNTGRPAVAKLARQFSPAMQISDHYNYYLEIVVFYGLWTRKYLHCGTEKSSGWLRYWIPAKSIQNMFSIFCNVVGVY